MVNSQTQMLGEQRIQEAAVAIAHTLRKTPALSWEEVKAVNRFAVWTVDTYSVPLNESDLSRAWHEAHSLN